MSHLPPEVERLYNEARNCFSVSAYTSGVLACRTLLMYVAVNEGADEGKSFQHYVDFFDQGDLVPKRCKGWINKIRTKGNEATHRIPSMHKPDLQTILNFTGMLLKIVYEFPFLENTEPGP